MTGEGRSSAAPVPPEVARLADRLYLAVVHVLRRLRRADRQLGLTAAQLSAITRLHVRGDMTIGELAEAEGVQPPTMTRLVQRLESEGLVIRRASPEDGRVSKIRHTSRASEMLERGRRHRVEAFGPELAALSEPDRAALERAVEILERLGAEG